MKDYKLIKVLKRFSPSELKKLKLFIQSPYFDFSEDNTLFFNDLLEQTNKLELDYRGIWKLSQNTAFSDERLRKKLHECLLITEKFLAMEEFQNSDLKLRKSLLDATVNKSIDELIPKAIKGFDESLNKEKALTFEYYTHRFHHYHTLINLTGDFERKIAIKKNRDSSEFMLKADKILNEIFLSEKLRLTHLINNDNSVSNKNDQLTFVEEVENFARRTARRGSKPYFYLKLIELSNSKNKLSEIEKLHKYISKRHQLFAVSEFSNIVFTLINEAVRILNSGNKSAAKVLFELYNVGLENNSFMYNEELLPDTFRNICVNACRLGEFEWTLKFIEDYNPKLNQKYRVTAVAFNKARVFINKKDYEEVIATLREVEFDDITYNLNTRLMLLVSYFELDELDALDSLIKSFNVYLRRKTNISERRKSSFKNFNSTIQDIVRVKERRDKVKLKNIRKKLESKMIAPNKDWLLGKVEELEKELGVKVER